MSKESSAVAVYNTHTEAETAIRALEKAGVNMKKLSISGQGLSCGRECGGLLQRRRPDEVLG